VTDLETFQFPATGQAVRTFVKNGEPWFLGRDACDVLGVTNHRTSLALLDEDERGVHSVESPSGLQEMVVVNEPGLYSLILRSRKPQAKAFKRWITHDVLPAIRKTGRYEVASQFQIPQNYAEALQLAADQARQIETQAKQLAIAAPKAEYVDGFVNAREDASVLRLFAGQVGTTEPKLRDYLRNRKVIHRRTVDNRWSSSRGRMEPVYQWLPYADYRKWFVAKDQPEAPRLHNGQMRTTLYVTPLGKVEIRRLLMKHPIAVDAA